MFSITFQKPHHNIASKSFASTSSSQLKIAVSFQQALFSNSESKICSKSETTQRSNENFKLALVAQIYKKNLNTQSSSSSQNLNPMHTRQFKDSDPSMHNKVYRGGSISPNTAISMIMESRMEKLMNCKCIQFYSHNIKMHHYRKQLLAWTQQRHCRI